LRSTLVFTNLTNRGVSSILLALNTPPPDETFGGGAQVIYATFHPQSDNSKALPKLTQKSYYPLFIFHQLIKLIMVTIIIFRL